MPDNIFLSIVVTTINRVNQFKNLIQSIDHQVFGRSKIQIIIIDQSDINLQENIKCLYDDVTFIKSDKISLSKARNLGLHYVKGEIVCFPDDDCIYEQGFFKRLYEITHAESVEKISYWQFPIYSIINKYKYVARNWNKNPAKIGLFNMLKNTASAGIFIRSTDVTHKFSENIGIGTKYSSCEDIVFIWDNILNNDNKIGYYVGASEKYIYHPDNNLSNILKQKDYNKGHIKAWNIIFNQSGIYNKALLCIYIIMTFLYHYSNYLYHCTRSNRTLSNYHRTIFWDRLFLLKRSINIIKK